MRGSLLALALLLAAAATAALLALLGLHPLQSEKPTGEPLVAPASEASPAVPAAPRLRAYETAATLVEDLRDTLGSGSPERLLTTLWEVSRKLAPPRAVWALQDLAPRESSPKVRALIVLAAGVHVPDGAALGALLHEDRSPVVRRAAVLAIGYSEQGKSHAVAPGGFAVPIGRALSPETAGMLRKRLAGEKDPQVLATMREVLRAAGAIPPR